MNRLHHSTSPHTRSYRTATAALSSLLVVMLLPIVTLAQPPSFSKTITWEHTDGPPGGRVSNLVVAPGGTMYLHEIHSGLYRSTDGGGSWSALRSWGIVAIAVDNDGVLFVGGSAQTGLQRSTDQGGTWTRISEGLNSEAVVSLATTSNGDLIAGTAAGGLYRSNDKGDSWERLNFGELVVAKLYVSEGGNMYAGVTQNGIYRSTDNGETWTNLQPPPGYYNAMTEKRGTLYATLWQIFPLSPVRGVLRLAKGQSTWQFINSGIDISNVSALGQDREGTILAGAVNGAIYMLEESEFTWLLMSKGSTAAGITSLVVHPSIQYFASTDGGGVIASGDLGKTWHSQSDGLPYLDVRSLTFTSAGNILAGGASPGGVYCYNTETQLWGSSSKNLGGGDPRGALVTLPNGNILAGTFGNGIFISEDDGASWRSLYDGTTPMLIITSLEVSANGSVFASSIDRNGGGIFRSDDNGTSWVQVNPFLVSVYKLESDLDGNIYACTDALFASTDNGETWRMLIPSTQARVRSFAKNKQGEMFAGTGWGEVHKSTDGGTTWTPFRVVPTDVSPSSNLEDIISLDDGVLLAATDGQGVYQSTDNGETWAVLANTLTAPRAFVLLRAPAGDVYVGTSKGVYELNISVQGTREVTGLSGLQQEQPKNFSLGQNYPNPFNPTTTIRYSVPRAGFVSLSVFDPLGREVAPLVNEHVQAGTYRVEFDASALPSGIYFYRLAASDFHSVKTMLLLK